MARRQHDHYDLRSVDLSKLDLSHIELDIDKPPSKAWRWLALFFMLTMGGGLLWFPSTSYYQMSGQRNGVFFVICGVAAVVGLLGGRWLWRWADEAAAEYAARRAREGDRPTPEEQGPPSALRRWLTLIFVVGGGAGILFGLPAMGYLQSGHDSSPIWYGAAIAAIVVGIFLGRWLLMQAEAAAPAERREHAPIRLPHWFKWVTLGVLIASGIAALIIPSLYSGPNAETVRFSLGGLGLLVGIVAAIWLARRFEETEQRLREETRRRRRIGQ